MGLSYQWYSSTTNSNTGGTLITGATNAGFPIPTGLAVSTYYYFCEVKSGCYAIRSDVAKVVVTPPPTIAGPSTVCYNGSTFTLNNPPPGIITWSVTGSFTVTGSGTAVTVTRTGTGIGGGMLTASVNGMVFTKPVTPCPPLVITGSSYVCDYQVWYSVSNPPSSVTSSQVKWTCSSNLQPYNGIYGVSKLFYVTGKGTG